SGLLQVLAPEQLRNLNGIQRRALAEVVADDPQAEAVLHGRVLADPADVSRIIADAFDRRHVASVLALIDDEHARRLAQNFARLVSADFILELDVHGFGMADED